MKDSFVRVHLSPKNDKKFTNESIKGDKTKISWRPHQAETICRINSMSIQLSALRQEMRFEWQLYLASQRLLKILWNGAIHMQNRAEFY